jgi:hypothetical protein
MVEPAVVCCEKVAAGGSKTWELILSAFFGALVGQIVPFFLRELGNWKRVREMLDRIHVVVRDDWKPEMPEAYSAVVDSLGAEVWETLKLVNFPYYSAYKKLLDCRQELESIGNLLALMQQKGTTRHAEYLEEIGNVREYIDKATRPYARQAQKHNA